MIGRWALLLSMAACTSTSGHDDSGAAGAAASAAMDSAYATFSAGYAALDADVVGALYTPDAHYLPPGGDIRHGRDSITAIFASFFDGVRAAGERLHIRFDSDDRAASGDLAFDIGHYQLNRFAGDSLLGSSRGKFVTVWRRGADGRWRIHTDGYSAAP